MQDGAERAAAGRAGKVEDPSATLSVIWASSRPPNSPQVSLVFVAVAEPMPATVAVRPVCSLIVCAAAPASVNEIGTFKSSSNCTSKK